MNGQVIVSLSLAVIIHSYVAKNKRTSGTPAVQKFKLGLVITVCVYVFSKWRIKGALM